MAIVTDETAYRLLWLAQWKLQQESEHMEPMLTKMIGHLSVYQKAAEYMEEHDVADAIFGSESQSSEVADEFSELLAHDSSSSTTPYQPEQPSKSLSTPPPDSSVVISAVEVDADAAEGNWNNPFSDDEEVSSVGEDDINWSSDDETEFGSVSSFEEENDAAAGDHGDVAGHGHAFLKEEKMGDVDMDPIWRRSPMVVRDADLLPPDVDGWARSYPPLARPGTPLHPQIERVALVGAS